VIGSSCSDWNLFGRGFGTVLDDENFHPKFLYFLTFIAFPWGSRGVFDAGFLLHTSHDLKELYNVGVIRRNSC
jgi:hypothetical protein